MDWELVWEKLRSGLQEVVKSVKATFPGISCSEAMLPLRPGQGFNAYVSFMFDPARGEHEDVLLYFRCTPASTAHPPPVDVEGDDVDFLLFEIHTPESVIMALEAVALPSGNAVLYEALVLNYVDRAISLARRSTPEIVAELKERAQEHN